MVRLFLEKQEECKSDLTPLSAVSAFSCRPHAYVKFWKHHCVEPQATKLEDAAKRRHEPFLSRFGGHFSCEWIPAKVLQVYEEDRESFDAADLFLDPCDYVTARLTGTATRSRNSASFMGLWVPDKAHMSHHQYTHYSPTPEKSADYEALYTRYRSLYSLLGNARL